MVDKAAFADLLKHMLNALRIERIPIVATLLGPLGNSSRAMSGNTSIALS
ncbi:hypothetical protein P9273_14460 [Mesorhizobium sp. WSM4935]|nr:hypothetical protein [Mesorhizobium sp. WSM4935]MDG4876298.1 hypothetical protein [Mesorhizobium sp. WSM4935]